VNLDTVCVDASLALTWLLNVHKEDHADTLRMQWESSNIELIGPPIFHAEVTSVLREEVFFKRLSDEEGEEAFRLYSLIQISIIYSPAIYRKAWELAKQYNLPRTYDMQYLAVAEIENCDFWTLDRKLVNTVRGKNRRVKWVGEYNLRGTT
jgi:predicted nucleic acid-binding protein